MDIFALWFLVDKTIFSFRVEKVSTTLDVFPPLICRSFIRLYAYITILFFKWSKRLRKISKKKKEKDYRCSTILIIYALL